MGWVLPKTEGTVKGLFEGVSSYIQAFTGGEQEPPPEDEGEGEEPDEGEEEPPPSGYCGDGICDANLGESTDTCPGDCPLTCGDGFCNTAGGELYSCPQDCPQSQCCIDTDGCPSETPYECPGACCCCPYGQVCCWTDVGWVCCGG